MGKKWYQSTDYDLPLCRWILFFKFKGPWPFKYNYKYPTTQLEIISYRLISLLTHDNFRWTVPGTGTCNSHFLFSPNFLTHIQLKKAA
jgi:hypothetical protein